MRQQVIIKKIISAKNKINKTVVSANIAIEEMPIDKMKTQMGIE